jgi:DNA replication protein DnaC
LRGWADGARQKIRSAIPRAYQGARLKDFAGLTVPASSVGYCLRGGTGIGKTHLATALLIDGMRPDHPRTSLEVERDTGRLSWSVRWVAVPSLLCRIRSSFGARATETEAAIIAEMVGVGWLLLDDLGAERQSDWSASTLYAIIAERRNQERVTIITTNQTLEEIAAWEPRLASRLAEMESVKLADNDRRLG